RHPARQEPGVRSRRARPGLASGGGPTSRLSLAGRAFPRHVPAVALDVPAVLPGVVLAVDVRADAHPLPLLQAGQPQAALGTATGGVPLRAALRVSPAADPLGR